MNERILHKDVQDFIRENLRSDTTKLILKGSPFSDVSIQELATQIVSKQKCEKKLPIWFQTENIYYPPKLNIEQTSSEITANYKSHLISGSSIVDITGGLGVDCLSFSKQFQQVTHCEINEELSQIASHNFQELKVDNITTIHGSGLQHLQKNSDTFDCIYIDPSRRNDVKGKVFLLEDCEPNVPQHIDFLFQKSETILIKTSPILDISSVLNELNFVKEIHIVAIQNEVKELLFLLKKSYDGGISLKTINFLKDHQQEFEFVYPSDKSSKYKLPQKFLYEPNSAVLKSGGFHEISHQLNVQKLHQHSHLYTSNELIDFPGRVFEILEVLPFDKKKMKKRLQNQKANITTRNFPRTVQQIRKELKIKDGGNDYIFFTTNLENQLISIFCRKV